MEKKNNRVYIVASMRNHKRPRKLSCQTSLSWPKTEELFLYFFPVTELLVKLVTKLIMYQFER